MPSTIRKFADVNGVRLHYLVAGKGDPIVLLHGYAETSHMWLPLIAKLADKHTVIAPDLRGFGESAAPGMATPRQQWRRTSTHW
jgi:pimeloyl-ACP methyl ester carboxylesterase